MIAFLFPFALTCVEPGEIFLMKLTEQAQGILIGERIFWAFDTADGRFALVGVDVRPPSEIHFDIIGGGGGSIKICSVEFPEQRITLRGFKLTDEEIAKIKEEKRLLRKLYRRFTPKLLWSGDFIMPVDGVITSAFGVRRYINGERRSPHSGIDIQAPEGATVVSSNSGVVVFSGYLTLEGWTVIIDHGLGLFTLYLHLLKPLVKRGEFVNRGQPIGLVGSTGRSTAPHLHFGVKLIGLRINPHSLLRLKTIFSSF